ncbi:sialate O-acetylesterase [Leptolyngbya sp. AN03gr2]|uniref:sialate O-acetylesterase n=1 Tax=Leptolyngbya sp. AN03gr2 TaxID=3423364 RepID=UPI003D3173AF
MTFQDRLSIYLHTGANEALTDSAATQFGLPLASWRGQASQVFSIRNGAYLSFTPPGNAFTQLSRLETGRMYIVVIPPTTSLPITSGVNGQVNQVSLSPTPPSPTPTPPSPTPTPPSPTPTPPAPAPDPTSYDIILAVGQSNAVGNGRGILPEDRVTTPGIFQRSLNGVDLGQISPAANPLRFAANNPDLVGFVYDFAKLHHATITEPGRGTMIVPAADNGTGFSDNQWNPGNSKYNAAVNATNQLIAQNPQNRIVAIVWLQGETDFVNNMSSSLYQTRLDAMIDAMRTAITGAANVPFIAGEMVPEWIESVNSQGIQTVTDTLPARRRLTATVSSRYPFTLFGNANDIIHYHAVSQRELGRRYFERFQSAKVNNTATNPPSVIGLRMLRRSSSTIDLTWDYPEGNVVSWSLSYQIGAGTPTVVSIPFNTRIHATGYQLTGLSVDTEYTIRVRAVNVQGQSSEATLTVFTLPNAWITQIDDTFNRANGAVGNDWVNVATAGTITIASNQVRLDRASAIEPILSRPAVEAQLNQEQEVFWTASTLHGVQNNLRWQTGNSSYVAFVSAGAATSINVGRMSSGTFTQVQSFTLSSALVVGTSYSFRVRATGTNPTTIAVEIRNAATQAVLGSGTWTDSTAALQVAGRTAVTSVAEPSASIDRIVIRQQSPSLNTIPVQAPNTTWQLLIDDNFNRTDGVNVGNDWVNAAANGTLSLSGGQLRLDRVSGIDPIASRPELERAIDQEMEIHWFASSSHGIQPFVRNRANNFYSAAIGSGNATTLTLARLANGVFSGIQTFNLPTALVVGTEYSLRIRAFNIFPTVIQAELREVATQQILVSESVTDATVTLQQSGRPGVATAADGTGFVNRAIIRRLAFSPTTVGQMSALLVDDNTAMLVEDNTALLI